MVDDNEFTDRQCQQGEGGFVIPLMEFKLKCIAFLNGYFYQYNLGVFFQSDVIKVQVTSSYVKKKRQKTTFLYLYGLRLLLLLGKEGKILVYLQFFLGVTEWLFTSVGVRWSTCYSCHTSLPPTPEQHCRAGLGKGKSETCGFYHHVTNLTSDQRQFSLFSHSDRTL